MGRDDAPITNLRTLPDRFCGRERELDLLAEAHRRAGGPIGILGAPGAGKTRLMLEFGHRLLREPGAIEVWLCDLSSASTAAEILQAVAAPLRIQGEPGAAQIGIALARRGPLALLLDGADRVIADVSALAETWRVAAPEAALIVTSRERLGGPGASIVLDALGQDAAEALFLDRARRLDPDVGQTSSEQAAVARLVEHLDRLPLAIELAAAQVRLLRPSQLVERIGQRLDLLESGERSLPERHRSLRAALDSAWALLEPAEQAALARCTVFRGGFASEAAETVLALPPGDPTALRVLRTLLDRSWLRSHPHPEQGDRARLWLFESVRAYAAERLEEADRHDAQLRHARYYLALFEAAREPPGESTAERSVEQANLWAAQQRHADTELGARLALCLHELLLLRGPHAEHLPLLDRALGASDLPPPLQARLRCARGHALASQGRFDEAEAELEASRLAGDEAIRIESAPLLSTLWRRRGELARAEAMLRSALDARPTSAREARAQARLPIALARLLRASGRPARAVPLAERALADLGAEPRARASLLGFLGGLYHDLGELLAAAERLGEGAELARTLGAWDTEGYQRLDLSFVLLEQGEIAAASDEIALAGSRFRSTGNGLGLAVTELHRGFALLADGQGEAAARAFAQARTGLTSLGEGLAAAFCAAALADLDRLDEADEAHRAARERIEAAGGPLDRICLDVLGGPLDLARARRALALGSSADPHRTSAIERLQRAWTPHPDLPEEAVPAEVSGLVRYAARLLRRTLEATPDEDRTLRLDAEGRWFQIGQDPRVSCSRRRVLRRLLCALAEHRIEAPGQPMASETLVSRGWPGERILPDAARTRLHTALHTLRELGLRPHLLTREEGYLLDPAISVLRVDEP